MGGRDGRERLLGGSAGSSRCTLAAVAALAALAVLASVAVISRKEGAGVLLPLDAKQSQLEAKALAWFKKEHPRTAAIIGDSELVKEVVETTTLVVPNRPETLRKNLSTKVSNKHLAEPMGSADVASLPAGWYKGAVALSSSEWNQHLQGSILEANAMTLAKVASSGMGLAEQPSAPPAQKILETPVKFEAALNRLHLLPMSKDAASAVKCDDHADCLTEDVYSRFLSALEQGKGCQAGRQCELHQVWLTCGSQGVCPIYLYARATEATLRAMPEQQLHALKAASSIVLDEPKYPAVNAKKLTVGAGRPSVWASSEPAEYNKKAWAHGEVATGAHSKENTESFDHLKVREMKKPNRELHSGHSPEGNWATHLPSDDNRKTHHWYPSRATAEVGREDADGKQEAGTLRWSKKVVYAKGYPKQDGFHYLGDYQDDRTNTNRQADSESGHGLEGVNVYQNPLLDTDTTRSKSYKNIHRRLDRSSITGLTEASTVVNGAQDFVYGQGNSEKGNVPGVQQNSKGLLAGMPNPFSAIMTASAGREDQLEQVDAAALSQKLSGLSSLLSPKNANGLTQQQLAVLRDHSHELMSDFFSNGKHAAKGAAEPAMAVAGERFSNVRGGLVTMHDSELAAEGVESPDATRARKMRAEAARLMHERADAREMRERGEERRALAKKEKARHLALTLDGSLPVTEEGALLAKSEWQYVRRLEDTMHKKSGFERTEEKQRTEEHTILHARQMHMPHASRRASAPEDMAVRTEEARLEQEALHNGAKEIGVPKRDLQHNVRARLAGARTSSTDAELQREEVRLEKQAIGRAAKEIGVSKQAVEAGLQRNVRALAHSQASRGRSAGEKLNINMVGAHRKVGPSTPGIVAEGDLESMDQMIFGQPASESAGKQHKASLPGVHLWGLSMSPDLNNAAKATWKKNLKEMHLSHRHTNADLRDGIWSGREASMQAARLQQLALPSSAVHSDFWPSGHAADERVKVSALTSIGGAEDFSIGGLVHSNSVNSDTKFARDSWGDDVKAPCNSNDAGLCDQARAQPQVTIGAAPMVNRKSAATQLLSEGDTAELRDAQQNIGAARQLAVSASADDSESVSSMMLSAMGKNPEPYEERKLARTTGSQSPGVLQMMKGVWAGEGNVGAEWHKCEHGDINCPTPEMGGYAAKEPYNHISGEYSPARWPADPVRAHYGKRLDGETDARDYYNDDVVTPMRHNMMQSPESPDPSFTTVDYHPHAAYLPENKTDYPHLVRWDKESWAEAAEADAARAEHSGDDDWVGERPEGEDDNDEEQSPEDIREEEEEEEDETGLRPGIPMMTCMRSLSHAQLYTQTQTQIHVHKHTCTHTHTQIHTRVTSTHARTHARTHAHMHAPARTHTHANTHTHPHTPTHPHAHTHTHAHTHLL